MTGAFLGLVAGLAVATLGQGNSQFGTLQVLGLFGFTGAGAGALLAGGVAVVLEQRSVKRSS